MSAQPSLTPNIAPRTIAELKQVTPYQLRTLAEKIGAFATDAQKTAWHGLDHDQRCNEILRLLNEWDKQNPGAYANSGGQQPQQQQPPQQQTQPMQQPQMQAQPMQPQQPFQQQPLQQPLQQAPMQQPLQQPAYMPQQQQQYAPQPPPQQQAQPQAQMASQPLQPMGMQAPNGMPMAIPGMPMGMPGMQMGGQGTMPMGMPGMMPNGVPGAPPAVSPGAVAAATAATGTAAGRKGKRDPSVNGTSVTNGAPAAPPDLGVEVVRMLSELQASAQASQQTFAAFSKQVLEADSNPRLSSIEESVKGLSQQVGQLQGSLGSIYNALVWVIMMDVNRTANEEGASPVDVLRQVINDSASFNALVQQAVSGK